MRILRVAQKAYPDAKGGGAYHVHAMSRDQAEMGHDVTVLTVGESPKQESRAGYKVVRRPAICKPLGNSIAPGVMTYLVKAKRFDVIHAHSHLYSSTNLAALIRMTDGTPLAITNHGLYSQTAPPELFAIYLRTLGRWTFNVADVVFTYTEEERENLQTLGVESEIEVVGNGIDTDKFTPSGPADDKMDSPAVLFVGRLVDGKRPLNAVHALAVARSMGLDATLYVAGTGPLEAELRRVAVQESVDDAVEFLGHVPYEEMPAVYRAADVLVLPSRDEGFPRTVLEAMASGVPVVSSDLDQISPLVEVGGRTVDIADGERLGNALVEEVTSEDRTPRAAVIKAGHDWQSTVCETTEVLRELAFHS